MFYMLSDKKINYSNYKLKEIDGRKVYDFTPELFFDPNLEECNVFIDEAYTFLESRSSMKDSNLFLSYMVFQSRKN